MRFFIQHETQKKLLTADNYDELRNFACEMFELKADMIELLFIDPSDNSEITISNQNDFKEILTEIEEQKSKGNTSKPVILIKKAKIPAQLSPNIDHASVASTVVINPVGAVEAENESKSVQVFQNSAENKGNN